MGYYRAKWKNGDEDVLEADSLGEARDKAKENTGRAPARVVYRGESPEDAVVEDAPGTDDEEEEETDCGEEDADEDDEEDADDE